MNPELLPWRTNVSPWPRLLVTCLRGKSQQVHNIVGLHPRMGIRSVCWPYHFHKLKVSSCRHCWWDGLFSGYNRTSKAVQFLSIDHNSINVQVDGEVAYDFQKFHVTNCRMLSNSHAFLSRVTRLRRRYHKLLDSKAVQKIVAEDTNARYKTFLTLLLFQDHLY